MSESHAEEQSSAKSPPRARFRPWPLVYWLPLCVVHGFALAWLAFGVQRYFAPLIVFPVLVGVVAGVTLAGLMRLLQVSGRLTIVAGTIVACGAAVYGQHYFGFQEQRETAERQAEQFRIAAQAYPDLVRGTAPRPASGVMEFLRWQAIRGRPIAGETVARGSWAWASWALDGGLTLLAALLITVPASGQPYCDQCRSWYRTVRRGLLDSAVAPRLAEEFGVELPAEGVREVRYRLVSCQGGCGVTGFEICWMLVNGRSSTKRVWISATDRSELERLLSPAGDSSSGP